MNKKLMSTFFQRSDVLQVARDLLGRILVTYIDGKLCRGRIVEVEAYNGRTDKACHAYGGRRTKRTEVMYQSGGIAYVYLCYGIHHLFNVVTNVEGMADAVLIRALEPMEGEQFMQDRIQSNNRRLTNGPGLLAKAMGIDRSLNGSSLNSFELWIEDSPSDSSMEIIATKRIGVDYAEEDASLPWRYYIKNSDWVSKF